MSAVLNHLKLSPMQQLSIVNAKARINVWDGAIRSGKTFSSLLAWLMYVNHAPKGELLVVGKTTHTIQRNVFAALQDMTPPGTVTYNAGAPTGKILGRTVHVLGAADIRSEAKLRGFTCAGAYVDEATLIDESFFTQLLGRMSVPGSKLFATTNPDSPAHWLKTNFLDRYRDLDLYRFQFVLDDNPGLTDEYKRSIKAEYTGLFYRRFIEGEWVAADGAIFDQFDRDKMVVDQLPRIERWISVGVDYGTTNPFHAVLIGLGADHRLYAAREYRWDSKRQQRQCTDMEYSQQLRDWIGHVQVAGSTGVRPQFTVVDPSAASFKVQLQRDGLTPTAGDNRVADGVRTLSSLFNADKLKIHASCRDLLEEIPSYSWDNRAALMGEDKPIKLKDHGIDALRYGVYTTRALWKSALDVDKFYGLVDA